MVYVSIAEARVLVSRQLVEVISHSPFRLRSAGRLRIGSAFIPAECIEFAEHYRVAAEKHEGRLTHRPRGAVNPEYVRYKREHDEAYVRTPWTANQPAICYLTGMCCGVKN